MPILTALVPATALPAIQQALHGLGVPGLTVSEVQWQTLAAPCAHGLGQNLAAQPSTALLKLELVAAEHDMAALFSSLSPHVSAAPAESTGLYVQSLERAIRIRTGETHSHETLKTRTPQPRAATPQSMPL